MNILGLVYTSHDAGLALLTDGKPNVVLEEERFNRIKHTINYPRMAMADVFGPGKLSLDDIDVITCPWDMQRIRRSLIGAVFRVQTLGCPVIWGASANTGGWWDNSHLNWLGWTPQDNAEAFRAKIDARQPRPAADAAVAVYQGGVFTQYPIYQEERA